MGARPSGSGINARIAVDACVVMAGAGNTAEHVYYRFMPNQLAAGGWGDVRGVG